MKISLSEQLDPAPFREWCSKRIRDDRSDAVGGALLSTGEFARRLGITTDKLRVWRRTYATLNRIELEEALRHGGYEIWDVYPEFVNPADGPSHGYCPACKEDVPVDERRHCLWCDRLAWRRKNRARGYNSRLSDLQVRHLYETHKMGVSVAELGRRIWKASGYASPGAAEKGIRSGFKRLNLATIKRTTPLHRRCTEIKTCWPDIGSRCRHMAMLGSEFCREHDPERRQEVMASINRANEALEAAA